MGDITKFSMFTRIHAIIWEDIDNLIRYCDSGFADKIELKTFREIYLTSVIHGKHISKSLSGHGLLYGKAVFENNKRKRDYLKYEMYLNYNLKIAGDRYTISFVYNGESYTFRRECDLLDKTNQMIKYQLEDNSDRYVKNSAKTVLLNLENLYGE